MEKVYTGRDEMEAELVKTLLEAAGIRAEVLGKPLEGTWSDIPLTPEMLPAVWVNPEDVAQARAVVEEYEQGGGEQGGEVEEEAGPAWVCPKCGEEIEGQFNMCWNCETERPE